MALELGFYLSIAVAGWLALGALLGRHSDAGTYSLAVFAAIAAFWSLGELMILHAAGPAELVTARRVFFFGSAGLPPAWLWVGVRSAMPGWYRRRPALIALAFAAPAFFYSCLYWDRAVRFVSWDSPEPLHGPWFDVYLVHQYLLIAVGTLYFFATARRLGRSSAPVMSALILGVALPLSANLAYYLRLLETDWTAAALGPAGILIWIALVDSGLSSNLPIDRNEVIEQLDVGVVVADLSGRILSVNGAAERLVDRGELRGSLLPVAVAAAEQRVDAMIETRAIALRGRFGIVGHALILTDRTEAENSRRRLELGGRLEALGSLTAGIAHEVNNPLAFIQANLSAIGGTAKALSDPSIRSGFDDALGDAVDEMACIVEETQEGFERIRQLVERLRNFSRSPDLSATAAPVDLEQSVRQAAAVATIGHKGEPIEIEGGAGLCVLSLSNVVFQVLVNLLLNAVQASPEAASIRVRIATQGEGVAIRVEDQGPGISEALLSRIFDPFFTTKSGGTGLGLALSYDLALQLGGQLEARNAEGGGAIFELWLPAVLPSEEAGDAEGITSVA